MGERANGHEHLVLPEHSYVVNHAMGILNVDQALKRLKSYNPRVIYLGGLPGSGKTFFSYFIGQYFDDAIFSYYDDLHENFVSYWGPDSHWKPVRRRDLDFAAIQQKKDLLRQYPDSTLVMEVPLFGTAPAMRGQILAAETGINQSYVSAEPSRENAIVIVVGYGVYPVSQELRKKIMNSKAHKEFEKSLEGTEVHVELPKEAKTKEGWKRVRQIVGKMAKPRVIEAIQRDQERVVAEWKQRAIALAVYEPYMEMINLPDEVLDLPKEEQLKIHETCAWWLFHAREDLSFEVDQIYILLNLKSNQTLRYLFGLVNK